MPPPDDRTPLPACDRRSARLAPLALEASLRIDPTFRARYDDLALRRILRDDERHIEQLARALETGEERFVTDYGEHIVPIYRRRDIRMNDYVTILGGLREAALSVLPGEDAGPTTRAHRPLDRARPPPPPAGR